jgi:hypothetical protein
MSLTTSALYHLTDEQLVAELTQLAQRARSATTALVAHLAEFDARRLYLGLGFSSLFAYCTGALRLSGHEAYNRIEAARAARRFPIIFERLAEGDVTLTSVRLLAPHLTPENHEDLLTRAIGKSRLQVEELVAACFPKPAVPDSIRRLPTQDGDDTPAIDASVSNVATGSQAVLTTEGDSPLRETATGGHALSTAAAPPPAAMPRRELVPLAPDRYKITFTANADTWRKLRQARELLRHQVPEGELGEIIDRALAALLEQLSKRKFAAVVGSAAALVRPTSEQRSTSRHIPAAVRRAVWLRDDGACAFSAPNGRRCGERAFVEFHHKSPYAADGPATTANISLRCRSHNGHEAELYFASSRRFAAMGSGASEQPP